MDPPTEGTFLSAFHDGDEQGTTRILLAETVSLPGELIVFPTRSLPRTSEGVDSQTKGEAGGGFHVDGDRISSGQEMHIIVGSPCHSYGTTGTKTFAIACPEDCQVTPTR